MKAQELRICIDELKKEIEKLLEEGNIQEIVLQIGKQKDDYIFMKDNQLMILMLVCSIWSVETQIGVKQTFLEKACSLTELEELYMNLSYYCRRFENDMPQEYLLEGIEYILEKGFSGVAIYSVIEVQTWKTEENALNIARYLKSVDGVETAILLLQMAIMKHNKNNDLLMELADCWLLLGNWKQAQSVLGKIEKPSDEVQEIMKELEEVLGDESIK